MTDAELMAAVCAGDQKAYQVLVGQYLKSISHYAFRLLGNRGDAEDITQETFLRLWLNARKWDGSKARLSTWLYRITHNLCVDHLRKHGSLTTDSDAVQSAVESDPEADDAERGTQEQDARMQQLLICLRELPETQRSAIMLCHHNGFSNKEAADIMGLSLKALESTLTRARTNLKTMLNQEQEVSE